MSREVIIYDQSFVRLFPLAHIMTAGVRPSAKNMEHPVASGAIITDHRIINPVELRLSLLLDPSDYKNTYDKIAKAFKTGELLTVSTRSGVFKNMLLNDIPDEETARIYNTITMVVSLKQVIFVRAQYGVLELNDVSSPSDSSTVDKGVIQPKSVAASAFDSLVAAITGG